MLKDKILHRLGIIGNRKGSDENEKGALTKDDMKKLTFHLKIFFMVVFTMIVMLAFPYYIKYIDKEVLSGSYLGKLINPLKYSVNLTSEKSSKTLFLKIGDDERTALRILGAPDKVDDFRYTYGNSYILVSDGKVIGYSKNYSDKNFPVKAGDKNFNIEKRNVELGDSSDNVINILGSPDLCLPYVWKYEKCELIFDEKMTLAGYTDNIS